MIVYLDKYRIDVELLEDSTCFGVFTILRPNEGGSCNYSMFPHNYLCGLISHTFKTSTLEVERALAVYWWVHDTLHR